MTIQVKVDRKVYDSMMRRLAFWWDTSRMPNAIMPITIIERMTEWNGITGRIK